MFGTIMFFLTIIFPIGAIRSGIKLKVSPYRVVVVGTLYSAMGALLFLALMYASGNGAGAAISDLVTQMSNEVTSNPQYLQLLGLEDKSAADAQLYVTQAYQASMMLLPTAVIVWGAVVSFFEYRIISSSMARKMADVKRMIPVREFNMNRNAFLGWLLVYAAAWGLQIGTSWDMASAVYMNVYALVKLAFAYQGISLVAYIFHMRRWPKAVWVILVIILMGIGYGVLALYIMGLIDAVFNLKGRIGVRKS